MRFFARALTAGTAGMSPDREWAQATACCLLVPVLSFLFLVLGIVAYIRIRRSETRP